MADRKSYDEQLDSIMNRLANSVMELSDEEILARVREKGYDPEETAERTRAALRSASDALELANTRLWDLGHTVNPNYWYRKDTTFHNNCLSCGSLISFTPATKKLGGLGATTRCVGAQLSPATKRQAFGR